MRATKPGPGTVRALLVGRLILCARSFVRAIPTTKQRTATAAQETMGESTSMLRFRSWDFIYGFLSVFLNCSTTNALMSEGSNIRPVTATAVPTKGINLSRCDTSGIASEIGV